MKLGSVVVAFVAAFMLYATTGSTEEGTHGRLDSYDQIKALESHSLKDECLIVAKNCVGDDDTVMKRVERINKELDKGVAVYSPEELKVLHNELNWIFNESKEFSTITM